MSARSGVERSIGAQSPKTPTEWRCSGVGCSSGGACSRSTASASTSIGGVAANGKRVSSCVRATPWASPNPGS